MKLTPEQRAKLTNGSQVRTLPARLVTRAEDGADDGAREIQGIGVPYNQPTVLWPGVREQFAPGAVAEDAQVMLFYRHDEPIGRVLEHHNAPDGWHVDRASISRTRVGDDAYTLAKDDVIRSLSIGFYPREWTEEYDALTDEVLITHTAVDAREVSMVPIPAYGGAALTEVRHQSQHRDTTTPKEENMTPEERAALLAQVGEIRAGQDELARRVEIGLAGGAEPTPRAALAEFRSFGEYVRAAASGEDRAAQAMKEAVDGLLNHRAYEGGTSANVDVPSNSWVGDVIELTAARQPVASTFVHTYDLPAQGLKVDYGVMGENTLKVDKQENEGEDLPYGEVSVGHDSADIDTYGGYSKLTRQEIERMPVNMLDLTFEGLAINYANRIEYLARKVFTDAATRALTSTGNSVALGTGLAAASSTDWLALILDLAEKFDGRGRAFDGIKVSREVFLALASVESTDRMLVVGNTPAAAGTLDVTIPEANLYGTKIQLVPNWTGANLAAYDKRAIRTQESPGAPFRLQDSNIINLTEAFSVYGYAASYQQLADGIIAADLTGAAL